MKSLRIVFMGTPDFAVPTLEALIDSHHNVVGVFCQPDKAKGRGQRMQMPPVKEMAVEHVIPVFQPETLKDDSVKEDIKALKPDLCVVIAYGKILPEDILTIAPMGCINLHGSILPAYRGAAPIQWAVLNGDKETGVTVMQMDEGMDTGDILSIIRTRIGEEETSGELFDRLAKLGADKIVQVIDQLAEGEIVPVPQNDEEATYTSKITKDMGLLDWSLEAHKICNTVRGLSPWPGAFTFMDGKRMRIWKATVAKTKGATVPAGTIVAVEKDHFDVQTGDGIVSVWEVQLDNKKRMAVSVFLTGHPLKEGLQFDEP